MLAWHARIISMRIVIIIILSCPHEKKELRMLEFAQWLQSKRSLQKEEEHELMELQDSCERSALVEAPEVRLAVSV